MKALIQFFWGSESPGDMEADWLLTGMGITWFWFWLLVLGIASWLGYRVGAAWLSPWRCRLLLTLRVAFLTCLLVVLARPVLNLTINKPVRSSLAVLIDDSASMSIRDQRDSAKDIERAELMLGHPVGSEMPSRTNLVQALGANKRIGLWEKIHRNWDLVFSSYAEQKIPLGRIDQGHTGNIDTGVSQIVSKLTSRGRSTATGDAIRSTLEETGPAPPSALLLISDGSSNTGFPAGEAAAMARQTGVPIYTYGTGIESPSDIMVRTISGSRGVFKNEIIEFQVVLRAPMQDGKKLHLALREGTRVVKEEEIEIKGDGDQTFKISYTPDQPGVFEISASVAPQPGEASPENNSASMRLRVLDDRIGVLYLEQEPRWDFRYLLAALERDKRLDVHCLLFSGDPVKPGTEGKPFLAEFPESLEKLAAYSVIILGDVDPASLGDQNMRNIQTWVSDLGGAVVFLAGRSFNPVAYASTPLEKLLPVELDPSVTIEEWKVGNDPPVSLLPTLHGETEPMFRLAADPSENRKIWREFPEVEWTARVSGPRMGAQVLLEDSRNSGPDGPLPVVATMSESQGTVLYVGFDQTHRWRSRTGERYYAAIWAQIIQRYAIDRQLAMSRAIQLKSDQDEYSIGDKVKVSGRIFEADFQPLKRESVRGIVSIRGTDGTDLPSKTVLINAVPGMSGEFQAEIETPVPGTYTLSTELDPATISFEVRNSFLEMADTALNAAALRTIAEASGGQYLREEDLEKLPSLLREKIETYPVVTKFDPVRSPWFLVLLVLLVSTEWLLRRMWNLK